MTVPTLFDPAAREAVLGRLRSLHPDSARRWGRMDPAQALAHCAIALEAANGTSPRRQKLIGKILAPLVSRSVLGPEPFGHGKPTDPTFVVRDPRDLGKERDRLLAAIEKFAAAGSAGAARWEHAFFGRLTGEEWGALMWKHLDHHLRQFGA